MQDADRQSHSAPPVVGSDVRVVADVLAALFEHDQRLAVQLNAAQARLLGAADLLRLGVSRDAARALLGASGPDEGLAAALESGVSVAAVEAVGDSIRRAFRDYQSAAEERRQLAADVGEATVRLVDALIASGFTEAQARTADVRALRDGVYRPGG
jgi:hypothetical protein